MSDSIIITIKYRFTDEEKNTMETAVSMTGNPDMGCMLKYGKQPITPIYKKK